MASSSVDARDSGDYDEKDADTEGLLDSLPRRDVSNAGFFNSKSKLGFCLSFSIFLNILTITYALHSWLSTSRFQIGGDVVGISPKFSQQEVIFLPNKKFARGHSEHSSKNDTAESWLSIFPRGMGWVKIQEPEKYPRLPPPVIIRNETVAVASASMVHQLHCLHMIMESYDAMAHNETVAHPMNIMKMSNNHIDHCFDYLRQSIMCCGDTALEGMQTTLTDENVKATDGWGATHVCKNYEEVIKFLEDYRVSDQKKL